MEENIEAFATLIHDVHKTTNAAGRDAPPSRCEPHGHADAVARPLGLHVQPHRVLQQCDVRGAGHEVAEIVPGWPLASSLLLQRDERRGRARHVAVLAGHGPFHGIAVGAVAATRQTSCRP